MSETQVSEIHSMAVMKKRYWLGELNKNKLNQLIVIIFSKGHAMWHVIQLTSYWLNVYTKMMICKLREIDKFNKYILWQKKLLKGQTKNKLTFLHQKCVNCVWFTIFVKKMKNELFAKLFFEVHFKSKRTFVMIVCELLMIHNFSNDNTVWRLNHWTS